MKITEGWRGERYGALGMCFVARGHTWDQGSTSEEKFLQMPLRDAGSFSSSCLAAAVGPVV